MSRLQLYTRRYCPYCDRAKAILASADITDYDEVPIDGDELKMRQQLVQLTGGRWDVPQAFFGETYLVDDDQLAVLAGNGELKRLLTHPA